MNRGWAVVATVGLLAVVGCSTSSSTKAAPGPSTTTAPGSSSAGPTPTTTPGGSTPFSSGGDAVAAGGTFVFSVPSGPTVTVPVPTQPASGWSGVGGPVGVGVAVPKLAALGVDLLARESLPPSPYATAADLVAALKPMPPDFMSYFRALPGITTTAPTPITIDGLSGQVVTYTVGVLPAQAALGACYGIDTEPCLILDTSADGTTYVDQGDTGEEAVLNSPWGPLAVSWEAPAAQQVRLGPGLAAAMRAIKFHVTAAGTLT